MVTLTISPRRGNHARYFPHSGYLGLTPVVVAGVVETKLEEDNQPIEASRLIVRIRCYEAIGSSLSKGIRPEQLQEEHSTDSSSHPIVNSSQSSSVNVLWQTEKTLWAAPSNVDLNGGRDDEVKAHYAPLGDWKGSWKLDIPIDAVSNGNTLPPSSKNNNNYSQNDLGVTQKFGCAVGSITYKSWRSWWQVETVIFHRPAGVLGTKIMKSHRLYLVNYGEAQKYYTRSIEESRTLIQSTTRMTNRNLRYSITAPSSACCGDEVELIIRIGSSSSTLDRFNHHQEVSRDHRARTPEQQQGRVKDSIDGDVALKRLQVSLVRRLAIELVKSSPCDTNNTHSSRRMEDVEDARIGLPSMNQVILPSPFITHPTMINHKPNVGSNINNKSSKIQLTTFNTLTTDTKDVSKSNALFNNHSSSSQLNLDGYGLGCIVKLKIPIVKSKSHYSIGESFKTNSTTVNFVFQFKLSIKNKLTNRIEMIELNDLNVQIFSISKDQMKSALDQLNQFHNNNNHNNTLVYQNRTLLNNSTPADFIKDNNDSDDC